MSQPKNKPHSLLYAQRKKIDEYEFNVRLSEQGTVVSVGDGIIWIKGLPSASIDEILYLEDGSRAMVFQLEEDLVGASLLIQTESLTAGTIVLHSHSSLHIPVGDELLGRVLDPLGYPLDGLEQPQCKDQSKIDILSPPIIDRDFVTRPFYTGNKILDNLIPIGKGQRELLIGDNGLGKSSLALDIVINQKDKKCAMRLCAHWSKTFKRYEYDSIIKRDSFFSLLTVVLYISFENLSPANTEDLILNHRLS